MSIAQSILNAVTTSKEASVEMLTHYYEEGIISQTDLELYQDYLINACKDLEYRLGTIFGVCESRLQVKREKEKQDNA